MTASDDEVGLLGLVGLPEVVELLELVVLLDLQDFIVFSTSVLRLPLKQSKQPLRAERINNQPCFLSYIGETYKSLKSCARVSVLQTHATSSLAVVIFVKSGEPPLIIPLETISAAHCVETAVVHLAHSPLVKHLVTSVVDCARTVGSTAALTRASVESFMVLNWKEEWRLELRN